MPTIEIISFERKIPIKILRSSYNFAIRQNTKLVSHRGLFQDYLDANNGVILHIGNLKLAKECFFFAGELIDWDFEYGEVVFPMIDSNKPYEEQWKQILLFRYWLIKIVMFGQCIEKCKQKYIIGFTCKLYT